MFSYISAERRVPKDHPLRAIRVMADAALKELGPCFDTIYANSGRPSIAPEKLLRALLLQILYTVRSERQLMEQLDYNSLFRWFVGLSMDDPVWDVTVFTKNRERLLAGEVAQGSVKTFSGDHQDGNDTENAGSDAVEHLNADTRLSVQLVLTGNTWTSPFKSEVSSVATVRRQRSLICSTRARVVLRNSRTEPGSRSTDTFLESDDW